MKYNNLILFLLIIASISSCDLLQVKDDGKVAQEAPKPIARANDHYLYVSDIDARRAALRADQVRLSRTTGETKWS